MLYGIYHTRGPLNFPFICIIRVPVSVHLLSRGLRRNPSDVAAGSYIGGQPRPRNIHARIVPARAFGIVSRFRRRKVKIWENGGSVSRAQRRGVSKCPAKIAAAECFEYHRDEIIFLTVHELLQT